MHDKIEIFAKASGQTITFQVSSPELQLSLLDFLLNQDIPIASSCSGRGRCQMCIFSNAHLSCRVSVKEVLEKNLKIEFSYL